MPTTTRGSSVPRPSVSPRTPASLRTPPSPRLDDEVVRPLQPDRAGRRARRPPRPPRPSPATTIAASRQTRSGASQVGPEPERQQQRRARRRDPGPAVAPAAGGLLVGDREADLGRPVGQPVADDVVRRADRGEPLRGGRGTAVIGAGVGRRQPRRRDVDRLGSLELEGVVQRAQRGLELVLGDDAGDPDLGGRDHLDVDAGVGERPEHPRRVARRVVQPGADDRDLGRPTRRSSARGRRARGRPARAPSWPRASSTRGTVNDRSVAPPWPTFWTIMSTLMPASASGSKIDRATPGPVRHGDDRDLGDVPVVGEPADLVALLHERVLLDERARGVLERAEDLDDDVVDPAELDGPDLHDLGALVGELEHLLVADDRQLAGRRRRAAGRRCRCPGRR